jgi:hypothetical protein
MILDRKEWVKIGSSFPQKMRLIPTLAFTLFALPCALAAPQNSQVAPAAVLPSVTATALDRQKVTLPDAFARPYNLLILFFQRDQQAVVDGWAVATASTADPRLQTWLLPISQRENELFQWWLNASFRGGLTPSEARRYTVPLYVDKRRFLGSLQVSNEQDVAILVTDKAGHVVWRSTGPVTEGKKADLAAFLSKAP